MTDKRNEDLASDNAIPKTSPEEIGEFSSLPKGNEEELLEKSVIPKGGGQDEASTQPKTVMPETDTIVPPANRD